MTMQGVKEKKLKFSIVIPAYNEEKYITRCLESILRASAPYKDQVEMIAAHSSPVMVHVERAPLFAAADALTILEQIEGALAYLDTVGTRAEDVAYKRMRLVLTSVHRTLHNRMHQSGCYHNHTPVNDHPEHH